MRRERKKKGYPKRTEVFGRSAMKREKNEWQGTRFYITLVRSRVITDFDLDGVTRMTRTKEDP